MDLLQALYLSGRIILGMMTVLWLLSLAVKNSGIVDIFWGAGFVIVNLAAFCVSEQTVRQTLLTVCVTLWGLRLSIHIFFRNRGKPEDFRYAQWREENGPRWWWVSLFTVFDLQGILLLMIAVPLIAVQTASGGQSLTPVDVVGIAVWAIGFLFEAVGDYQLTRFKANPMNKGKVLASGLWRYTRHPNYFGDAVQWWGFYLFASAAGSWWTVFSPLLMTFLLLRISGVPLLERTMKTRPGYEEYLRSTNAFVPWFPRR
jgi:steroid 5-alpha reductase family enzyme